MKILLFANYNAFSLSLISRLNKENHQVFVVTGKEQKGPVQHRNIFQEYNFPYNSHNISYIIENVEPDVIILGGPLVDTKNISDYLAGITNIIHDLKNPRMKHLIYLSSLSIFSGNLEAIIDEKTIPKPTKEKEKALLMGEKICTQYDGKRGFKVSVLRYSQIYGTYNTHYLADNRLSQISTQMIKNEEVDLVKNKRHMLLYIDDGVDALYKAMNRDNQTDEIYHIGPNRRSPYSEDDLMIIFKGVVKHKKPIKVKENHEKVSGPEFSLKKQEQLGFSEKHRIKLKLQDLYTTIEKNLRNQQREEEDQKSILSRLFKLDGKIKNKMLPYFENVLFFIILNIFIYLTQSMSIHEVLDFYLLYVIVVGVIYGYEQTILTVILSVAAKRLFGFSWTVRALTLPNHFTYMWILQLFTVGVLVGYIKEQYKIKHHDMEKEVAYLNTQLTDVKDINKNNKEIKDLYEQRLLNYKDSFGRIYEIVSELEEIEPQGIIFKSVGVVGKIMDTKDVAIYISGGGSGFFRLTASSSEQARVLGNSLGISDHLAFFQVIEKKQTYINTKLIQDYPLMAQGIFKNNELESIIMVWSLPVESNNLYQTNVFGITCKLIENSLNTAYEYIGNIKQSNYPGHENVLDQESFKHILDLYKYGQREGIVKFYTATIKRSKSMTQDEFFTVLTGNLRETDYIGEKDNENMCILLTNASKEESGPVLKRLENNGLTIKEGESNCG